MEWPLVKCLLLGLIVTIQIQELGGCFEEERIGLLQFKEFVRYSGASADRLLPSWVNNSESDCCGWERVVCNSATGHVTELFLHSIYDFENGPGYSDYGNQKSWRLNVTIFWAFKELTSLNLSLNEIGDSTEDEELSALEHLEMLDLCFNQLNGSLNLQDLTNPRSLKVLILQQNLFNDIQIVQGLANYGSLEILDFSENMFGTTVPSEIGMLISLKALSLSQNEFYGSLPSQGLCKLEKLEEFDVSWNHLEGTLPSCLKNLAFLHLLDLSRNNFTGHISLLVIASLTSLKYFDLSHNQFKGLFSFRSFANHSQLEMVQFTCDGNNFQITEISNWIPLFQLKFLVLQNCLKDFSGKIPSFLFHQWNLRVVNLSHNNLKGGFPSWLLENNTRLEYIDLSNNFFWGQFYLPLHLNFSISGMDVSANLLERQLQENIGNLLSNIRILDLSNNTFEGCLPSSFGNMSSMQKFDVSFNNFSSVLPKELVVGCSKLEVLKLSANHFHVNLFSTHFNLTQLSFLDFSDNQISGALSKKLFEQALAVLDGSNNKLTGMIPHWICNQTEIVILNLRHNLFKGHFQCKSPSFVLLDLSYNFLSGSLPSWSEANLLENIHFEGNYFSGSIPKTFVNALVNGSGFLTLDISDNKLSGSIPNILGAVYNLRVLLLNGNYLGGVIPTQLCQLINISMMDLSNNFLSGSIPSCFHNINFGKGLCYSSLVNDFDEIIWLLHYSQVSLLKKTFEFQNDMLMDEEEEVHFITKYRTSSYKGGFVGLMSGLDLSANKLTGLIPLELGTLSLIHSLNLSYNQLIGSIPETFSNLIQIESLDLSHNNLSGEIPSTLNNLHFLEVFTVAYNNLSGRIPKREGQFITFDERSYEGNPLLYGLSLNESCSSLDKPPPCARDSSYTIAGNWYELYRVVFNASFLVSYFMFSLELLLFSILILVGKGDASM